MRLELAIQCEVLAPNERVFDAACAEENLPRFFQRFGPLPGVIGSSSLPPEPHELGRRKVMLTDGSSMVEVIKVRERPHNQRYAWAHPPSPPLHLLVRGAEADWQFEPTSRGEHTHIKLHYVFVLTSPFALPLALVVRWLFRRWLAAALVRIKHHAEAQRP